MKNQAYQQPLIEQTEVLVEAGIATSTIIIDMNNTIIDMEEGDSWGIYE